MKAGVFVLCVALCLLSCGRNAELKETLSKMREQAFTLPLDSMVSIGDTLEKNSRQSALYKLVIYTDSSQCASCQIRSMRDWNPFAKRLKVCGDEVGLYFIFHPAYRNRPTLSFVMRVMPPTGFVYVDTAGCFARMNPQLPDNPAMHTLLLDRHNNVLLVGNPLNNAEIRKLFWKIVKRK